MEIEIGMGHFWIGFENGYVLSVFNGYGSHTENHTEFKKFTEIAKEGNVYARWKSETVEIGILENGFLVTDRILNCDDVVKTVNIEELIEVINIVKNLKANESSKYKGE